MENVLEEVYTDPRHPGSFSGVDKLRWGVRHGKKFFVTVKKVKEWLKGKDTYTKHRSARKNFKRNAVIATHIDAQWQGDLAEVGNLANKNEGVRYLLILVDVVSKYAWVEALKTKSGPSVLEGLKRIFERTDRRPERLQTDDGKEFTNKGMQEYLKENNIQFFTLKSEKKAALAERLVRTLKEKLTRYMHEKHTQRYIDVLQDLVASYNDTYHKAIKRAPSTVTQKNEASVLRTLYEPVWNAGPEKGAKAKIGDFVRISRAKHVFEKGYPGNWSEEIFIVDKVIQAVPKFLYRLKDWNLEPIEGSFYGFQIQVVDVDLKGHWKVEKVLKQREVNGKIQYLVKWEGYPASMNSWVDDGDIKKIGD